MFLKLIFTWLILNVMFLQATNQHYGSATTAVLMFSGYTALRLRQADVADRVTSGGAIIGICLGAAYFAARIHLHHFWRIIPVLTDIFSAIIISAIAALILARFKNAKKNYRLYIESVILIVTLSLALAKIGI